MLLFGAEQGVAFPRQAGPAHWSNMCGSAFYQRIDCDERQATSHETSGYHQPAMA